MPFTQKRIARVAAAIATTTALSVAVVSPSRAEPDINDVEAKVQRLYHAAEVAAEDYNEARERLRHSKARLAAIRADLARQRSRTELLRSQIARSVVDQYQGQALSSTAQVVLSNDPDSFLERLSTVSAFDEQQSALMADFARQSRSLEMQRETASRGVKEVAASVAKMKQTKTTIDRSAAGAREELQQLKAEDRARVRAEAPSRGGQRVQDLADVPASGRGAVAVRFALQQVGDRYVYGAAGPDSWDCSGLTMRAWEAAGVQLPHQSRMQMEQGTPVSISDLRPGDLVAYYSPISHIGMYIGNGKLVHAANPSRPVEVVPVDSMPINGAVRVG